jgi:hypothetical protein
VVDLVNVGPDAPIVENERGGKQSHVAYRYDLIPPEILMVLARIYDYGAQRYEPDNWKKISTEDHLNHVMVHLVAYRAGDRSDDHLGHMMWRAQAALYTAIHDLAYDARQPDEKEHKTAKFIPCPRCDKVDIEESAGICSACDAIVNNEEPTILTYTDYDKGEVIVQTVSNRKMCSECHENPVRYNGAGYCEKCHSKWYKNTPAGSIE